MGISYLTYIWTADHQIMEIYTGLPKCVYYTKPEIKVLSAILQGNVTGPC